ncbi:uncharacterized protein LOC123871255 [Maniola jurtina]|uniref:uncharacterized protein LOC123871255 n=1 Tax=Maniola jurtina TaxID=191418 RepID=UPI001E68F29B|nr:uncharacterized protein LOC123871255 [Maniola jurtina]
MMFCLLVLCAILTIVEPYTSQCRTRPPFYGDRCPGVTVTNLEIMSEPIEWDLIAQEERFVQFCQENAPAMIGEMYRIDNYYLVYDLIEARDSKITVRIKHKFLHITATEKYGNQEIIFQDVKVLPDMVNTDAAQWTFKNGETLIIKIPYRVPIGKHDTKSCPVVNKNVIDVPHAPESEFNYSLQDWIENTYDPAGRSSGSNYGFQGWSQNGHNPPPGRPSGPNYGSQGWSQNGHNPPPGRPSGPNYGSQGWSQNGHNPPPGRPSGSNYGSHSQDLTQNVDPTSLFIYRSKDSKGNIP